MMITSKWQHKFDSFSNIVQLLPKFPYHEQKIIQHFLSR
jgi:hypothetical protein